MRSDPVVEALNSIKNREDLIDFIRILIQDYQRSKDSWENWDLPSYLESMSAWLEDMGDRVNQIDPVLNGIDLSDKRIWRFIGEIVYSPKLYE